LVLFCCSKPIYKARRTSKVTMDLLSSEEDEDMKEGSEKDTEEEVREARAMHATRYSSQCTTQLLH
jgi:hypothetical protein